MNDTVDRAEWAWVISVATAVVFVSTIPYLAGWLVQNQDMRFTGAVFNQEDYNSYLGKMWQGYRGAWRYQSLFTSEPHQGAYLLTFYIALGHLARLTGLGVPLTYHLARIVIGIFLLLVVYRFIASFASRKVRRLAFLFAATSSGLGWLIEILFGTPPGGISPIDFWLIDAYTFFSLFMFPHFSASLALFLILQLTLLMLIEAQRPSLGALAAAGVLSWALGIIHPYMLLPADLVAALYLVWCTVKEKKVHTRAFVALVGLGIVQAPLLLYDYHIFTTSPAFQAWATQNLTLSPPPLHYLLGYGIVGFLAVLGIWPAWRSSKRTPWLLLWIISVVILAYLPWRLQRRFLEGVHVALCILAAYGFIYRVMLALAPKIDALARCVHYNPRNARWLVRTLVVLLASISNLYLVASHTVSAMTRHPKLFRSCHEIAAARWLAENTAWDDVILAGYEDGNWIVGVTGHRVALGHWGETIDFAAKAQAVEDFYTGRTPVERQRVLLNRWRVQYVYLNETRLPYNTSYALQELTLQKVFEQGPIYIYEVDP